MRILMKVSIPVDAGNRAISDGSLPKTIVGFVEQMKPEATYFVAEGGRRTGYFVFDLKDPASIPAAAEPFFSRLGADVTMMPAMNLEDMKTGVGRVMSKQ